MSDFWKYAQNRFIYDAFLKGNVENAEQARIKKQFSDEVDANIERRLQMSDEDLAEEDAFLDAYWARQHEEIDKGILIDNARKAKEFVYYLIASLLVCIPLGYLSYERQYANVWDDVTYLKIEPSLEGYWEYLSHPTPEGIFAFIIFVGVMMSILRVVWAFSSFNTYDPLDPKNYKQ